MNNNFILKVLCTIVAITFFIFSAATAKDYVESASDNDILRYIYPERTDQFEETINLLRKLTDTCTPYIFLTSADSIRQFEQEELLELCYRKALYELNKPDQDLVRTWFGGKAIEKKKLSNTIYQVIDDLGYTVERKKVHDLMLETAAIESAFGEVVKQKGGPARGVFQVIPATDRYVTKELKKKDPDSYAKVMKYYDKKQSLDWNRKYNVRYNAAVSLSYYYMVTDYNLDGLIATRPVRAALYKKKYNTNTHAYLIPRYMKRASQYLD